MPPDDPHHNGGMEPITWAQSVADWLSATRSLFSNPSPAVTPTLFIAPIKPPHLLGDPADD